jgi:hypothetical protein
VVKYFGLDAGRKGTDIEEFDMSHVYVPMDLWATILFAVNLYQTQYGLIAEMFNKKGVGHFFSNVRPTGFSR